ncbi:MAG: fluoride efflux transporter CrcB [Bacteroides sp.]|nr:fluoride efflux transporter CrcB [Bacteroides sp.]
MFKNFLLVFLGGGLGSVMRYGVNIALHQRIFAPQFPWATFGVNLAGSFLIGLFYAISERMAISEDVRLLLTVGLCGGFTTFSTFSSESLAMLRQGNYMVLAAYVVLSVVLGIGCCFLGASTCRICH